MDAKKILDSIGVAATIIGLISQLVSGAVSSKKQEMQIAEAVAKEVARQQQIPMKRGS